MADETLREALDRIGREIDALPFYLRWAMRRRLGRLHDQVAHERDTRLARWWNDPTRPGRKQGGLS